VPGDFAVRGGIVDIYLPGIFENAGEQLGLTVRVDFFDDQIESIPGLISIRWGPGASWKLFLSSTSRASFRKRAIRRACLIISRRTESLRSGRRWRSPSNPRAISIGCRK
jgi:hypothetical protein